MLAYSLLPSLCKHGLFFIASLFLHHDTTIPSVFKTSSRSKTKYSPPGHFSLAISVLFGFVDYVYDMAVENSSPLSLNAAIMQKNTMVTHNH